MTDPARAFATAPPLPVERRRLAEGVHMAVVGADIVALDLRADTYACLPHAADAIRLLGASVEADLGLLGLLADAGLLGEAAPGGEDAARAAAPPPVLPTRSLAPRAGGWSIATAAHFPVAVATARRLGRDPPIRVLVDALPRRPRAAADAARVAAVTAAFVRLMPWAPRQGACLHRTFLLLSLLRRAGADAAWVFGVRTWPFGAHCWLQVGDAVLDDDAERVSRYTPILAV